MGVQVVYDEAKDAINVRKHGLSLAAAERLDLDFALVFEDDREEYGETRYRAIGFIDGGLHVLIFVIRHETVRAISLRKATRKEGDEYAA